MHRKSILIFVLFVSFVLIYFINAKSIFANTLLFTDNFEENNLNQWTIIDGDWNIHDDNGNKVLEVNSQSFLDNEIQAGDFNWTDYSFDFDVNIKTGVDRNIFFRVNDLRNTSLSGHNLPVSYGVQIIGNEAILQKWTQSSGSEIAYAFDQNTITHLRIEAVGPRIKIFTNHSSDPEVDYIDSSNPILSGRIALGSITGNSYSDIYYDNVVVENLTQSFPSLNVPDIKQYTSPWAQQIYDSATKWSSNPTIDRWGCALTSAVMELAYNGHIVDPSVLNSWLKGQTDGYLGNGLVNWLAISRYSKLHETLNSPALEFKRLNGTNQNLITELENGRPAILGEPGHFIVAKSQTQTSFGINDPAYPNHPTLASYGNTFSKIYSFTPSYTDLSYIELVSDPNVTLTVKDQYGNNVDGDSSIEDPLIDDIDQLSTSGTPLQIFLFPKPHDGTYSVEVGGTGQFTLDSYIYDIDGNVVKDSFSSYFADNTPQKFEININSNESSTIKPDLSWFESYKNSIDITSFTSDELKFYNNKLKIISDLYNKGEYTSVEDVIGGFLRKIQSW